MNPNQWQQPQPTGYPSQMGGMGGGMMPQRTGYPGGPPQAMGGGYNPQMTGMQQGMGGHLTPMMTGMPQRNIGGPQQSQHTPSPMPSMQTGNYSFLNAPPPSSGFSGGGLTSQRTGFPGPGGGGGLQPQATGWQGGLTAQPTGMPHDPRLQMMMGSFMPGNLQNSSLTPASTSSTTSTFNSQFPPISTLSQSLPGINPSAPLTQNFQSLLSNPNVQTPKVPWTLSKQEKKDYDQIFRAWTGGSGGGFIDGSMAQEVFGQSGLSREDLMKIWNLSDVNNRGKLNLPEFHVAMGLIYRALNGNTIPDELPPEMVPPSMRDIDSTVDFVKDLLRNDNSARNTPSPGNFDNMPGTFGGGRNNNKADATVYKHDDSRAKGYKSSSRHIDRKAVRYEGEGADAELEDIKRQLATSSSMLDRSADEFAKKTREDEELEQELEDLKYRVRRVQEDIDYVSKGKRTPEKDEERRKLERELLYLRHERLPEIERKQHEVEERRKREQREGIKARDRRNEAYGRFDYDGGRRSSYDRDRGRDDDYDRYRSSYDRDRSRERDYDRRDSYDRDRRGSREEHDAYPSRRPISPPGRRSPPPVHPRERETKISAPPPAPARPETPASAAPSTKNMTAEERQAHIRAQAQARIQARLKALGMATDDTPETTSNGVDTSVQDRLEREKKEAEEKSRQAEKEQQEREAKRRARLESAGVSTPKSENAHTPTPPSSFAAAPPPAKSAMKKTPAPPPPPPSKRQPAPPPPPTSRAAAAAAPPQPKAVQEDPEDAEFRAREEAHKKAMAERQARLKRMQEEEEAAQREEEELLRKKREQAEAKARQAEEEAAAKSRQADEAAAKARQAQEQAVAPAPPPLPHLTSSTSSVSSAPGASTPSTNPFHRMQNGTATASSGVTSPPRVKAGGGFNPFLKPQVTALRSPAEEEGAPTPPPPAPPAPPFEHPQESLIPRSQPSTASAADARPTFAPAEEEWDVIGEKEDDSDDSSDDDYAGSRSKRGDLARALFGGMMPSSSRPSSAEPTSRPSSAAPPPALAKLGGGDPLNRGGLFAAIQSGAKLKKTETVDKSKAPGSGRVVGDASPSAQTQPAPPSPPAPARSPSPASAPISPPAPEEDEGVSQRAVHRQSVDWYSGLAADAHAEDERPSHHTEQQSLPSMAEEEEEQPASPTSAQQAEDPLADFDMTTTVRVRTLYPYQGQRDVDLSFGENLVLEAHKAKDPSSAWWYGTVVKDKKSGWFPSSYVAEIQPAQATAKYAYTGNSDEELPFAEGDVLTIVDQSDADWYKAEKAGVVFIVPAAYVELNRLGGDSEDDFGRETQLGSSSISPSPPVLIEPSSEVEPRPHSVEVHSGYDTDTDSDTSEDSFLSFDDDDDAGRPAEALGQEREQRERERHKVLEAAGLQLRREPPGVPVHRNATRRRRPPPAAPMSRNRGSTLSLDAPPAFVRAATSHEDLRPLPPPSPGGTRPVDAYDRYSSYLEETRSRPAQGRARSQSDVRLAQPRPISTMSATSLSTTKPEASSTTPPLSASSPAKELGGSRLSGFMSRMLAQPGTERRIVPVISGPMSSAPMSQSATEDGSAGTNYGQTWSSLVDGSVLETMNQRERKRQEAMFELIATEGDYVRDLQLIVEVFYASMMQILDEKSLETIFSNIEDILLFNTTLLSSLEERQKASRLYITSIGDILRKQLPAVSVYKPYCVNQAQGIRVLQSLRSTNLELADHLQRTRNENPSLRSLDLSSFLLEPMQRLTRYPLLLRQILNYTGEEQDTNDIKAALESAEDVLSDVNETIREAESQEKLAMLSEDLWIGGEGRLDLTAPTAYQGKRKLVKEGNVSKAKSGRKLYMVLCNDILVLIESRNLYRMPIPLHETAAKETPRDPTGFQVMQEYARGRDTIALKASSAREAQSWIAEINRCRQQAIKARQAIVRERRRSSGIGY